ncbi:MAG: YraN family protein [Elusimicrobiales bacterium]|jgi:putative endonuclease|nr:YraN family protein [Elusimicrobiales bacterium]NLH39168.1 YraN family protein [Elusimicrobiota bacterium]
MNTRGKEYEDLAALYIEKNGYKIVERNYVTRLGEVDIIAYDKKVLCFIEVKARKNSEYVPYEAVNKLKQRKIIKASIMYMKTKGISGGVDLRYDVVSIYGDINSPDILLIKNAFNVERYF